MVETVIRTMKTKIYKMFNLREKYKWIDKLDELTLEYNHTKHSTTKMRPTDIKTQQSC